ncbi:outer membrane beta-barrel protein [Aestuariivivens sediminis]|uniref:outer membrane beta-barrel protein n=1 Tax=Aestuariivivens sediminis TaxID=2913557 RepID=UPI001F5AD59F|nr:outer membrane beta-barrel protein [Aestuariivivens sediminis]
MKKLLFLGIIAFFTSSNVNAQGFKPGIVVGLPIGDAGDFSSFTLGVDVSYYWEVSEEFDLGILAGFTNSFLKSDYDESDDVQFLPIGAGGRYNASEEFYIGLDLGYGIGINEGNDGGFYYRPRVGYRVTETISLNLSYASISLDGDSWDNIMLGVEFGL